MKKGLELLAFFVLGLWVASILALLLPVKVIAVIGLASGLSALVLFSLPSANRGGNDAH
jgi:hypothetical protein